MILDNFSYVIFVTISFFFGIFLGLYFDLDLIYFIAILPLLFFLALYFRDDNKFLIFICLIALIAGFLRWEYVPPAEGIDNHSEISIEGGKVVSSIESTERNSRYVVEFGGIRYLVYEEFPTECKHGDEISFNGLLNRPEVFVSKTGRVVKYQNHLFKNNISGIIFSDEESVKCEDSSVFGVGPFFSRVREILLRKTEAILPEPESGLLAGLVLGVRSSLPKDLLDIFRITGLIHIIVLSGYNVTVVAESIRRILSFLPRVWNLIFALISIIAFVFLAGGGIVAVRAGAMAAILLLAKLLRRENDGIRILFILAFILVFINPKILIYDVSFHLSFLATLGLLFYSDYFSYWFGFITERFQLRGIISATVGTQIFLLPYLIFQIGEVSIIGVLANILVLPLIPFTMLFGVLVILLGFISVPIALFLNVLAYAPLKFMTEASTFLSKFPLSHIVLPEIPAFVALAFYIVLFIPLYLRLGDSP